MIKIDWNPQNKQLRQFSAIWFPLFCGVIGMMAGYTIGSWHAVKVFWVICATAAVLGAFIPTLIRPVFLLLIVVTFPVGWLVSNLLLILIFYLVVTPIGLLLRVKGHDPLSLRRGGRESMWTKVGRKTKASDYLKQY
jgi:hypothetical protein